MEMDGLILKSHHLAVWQYTQKKLVKSVARRIQVSVSRGYGVDGSYSMGSSPYIQMPCCVWRWWSLRWWIVGIPEVSEGREEVCEDTSVCVFSMSWG